jgi:hypothetical protein
MIDDDTGLLLQDFFPGIKNDCAWRDLARILLKICMR